MPSVKMPYPLTQKLSVDTDLQNKDTYSWSGKKWPID